MCNSTYGASKAKFNTLYDPLMANNVCIAGQLLLLDLIEKLEDYCKIWNINTDGIFMTVKEEAEIDNLKAIAGEWEQRTGLSLEWSRHSKIFQKDVNNYVLINEDGTYKSKGSYVKKLSKLDYDLPIVNKALIAYFTKNTPVEQTILNCDDLIEFQSINKITGKYNCIYHGEVKLSERCIRVFASKDSNDMGVYKENKETGTLEKIASTPENCYIDNSSMEGKKCNSKLDKNWYVELAKKRIEDFTGTSII